MRARQYLVKSNLADWEIGEDPSARGQVAPAGADSRVLVGVPGNRPGPLVQLGGQGEARLVRAESLAAVGQTGNRREVGHHLGSPGEVRLGTLAEAQPGSPEAADRPVRLGSLGAGRPGSLEVGFLPGSLAGAGRWLKVREVDHLNPETHQVGVGLHDHRD